MNDTGVSRLVPYARNARSHSEAQVAEIAGSIREFGFVNPVLIAEDGTLIAGHGRVLAARLLGMEKYRRSRWRGSRTPSVGPWSLTTASR
ncbi:ParB/Srx family N-terminal domain-containing protein [Paracoccus mutanolyticus]|uniref:ParB/Srx family N-terminal domain-containing protein n=1 Tax=Paracoccus mutanolyticus TaxID=1499308 RepID=UPI001CB8DC25|nr:ParB/Srx family N-terminal domain-containing protein [Paracoccus mutanolyticus]